MTEDTIQPPPNFLTQIEELDIFINTIEELKEKAYLASNIWEHSSHPDQFGKGYPFNVSFDELPGSIAEWIHELNDLRNFLKWQSTRRAVLELNDLQDTFGVCDGDIQGPGFIYGDESYIRRTSYHNDVISVTKLYKYYVGVSNQDFGSDDLEKVERWLWENWSRHQNFEGRED